jgi:hypothetical protein
MRSPYDDLEERRERQAHAALHSNGRFAPRHVYSDIPFVSRKITLAVLVVALLLGTMLLALSAQNDYCLPWQERVGHGDGLLNPGEDFTACR